MTIVNADTGEVIGSMEYPADAWVTGTGPLTADDARVLTSKIKGYASRLYMLLLEAHDRGAAEALGYKDWPSYVAAEFDMSASYAYRLISQAHVILELAEAAGVSPIGESRPLVSESRARVVAPAIEAVAEKVRVAVADLPPEATTERVQVVRETVRETVAATTSPGVEAARARRAKEAEARTVAVDALIKAHRQEFVDLLAAAKRERGL